MPITELQFDLGITAATEEWMRKVYAFLREHPDAAYNEAELYDALFPFVAADRHSLPAALEELTYFGGLEAHVVGKEKYFRFLETVPELA